VNSFFDQYNLSHHFFDVDGLIWGSDHGVSVYNLLKFEKIDLDNDLLFILK
jgi:hypothetical protein